MDRKRTQSAEPRREAAPIDLLLDVPLEVSVELGRVPA